MGLLSPGAMKGLGVGLSQAGENIGKVGLKMYEIEAERSAEAEKTQREIALEQWKKSQGHKDYASSGGSLSPKDAASVTSTFLKGYFAQEGDMSQWDENLRQEYSLRSRFISLALSGGLVGADGKVYSATTPGEANEAYNMMMKARAARDKKTQDDLKKNPASPQAQTKESKSILDMQADEMVDAFEGTWVGQTEGGQWAADKARQVIDWWNEDADQKETQQPAQQDSAAPAEPTGEMVQADEVPKEIKDKLKPGGSVQTKSGTLKFDGAKYTLIRNK